MDRVNRARDTNQKIVQKSTVIIFALLVLYSRILIPTIIDYDWNTMARVNMNC